MYVRSALSPGSARTRQVTGDVGRREREHFIISGEGRWAEARGAARRCRNKISIDASAYFLCQGWFAV
jgi:hypothetical protein